MPWCPKCKTEYREGITHCADCKVELVEDFKEVLLQNATAMLVKVDAEHVPFTKKLQDFLQYSGISSVILNEGAMVGVYVAPEDFNKAKRLFKAFYSVETEMIVQKAQEEAFLKDQEFDDYFGDDEEELDEEFQSEDYESGTKSVSAECKNNSCEAKENKGFVSAATRYEDYRSSGATFTVLGVIGIIFAVLNFMDVISLFGSTYSSFVLFVMFGIFLVLGIFSYVKAESLKADALAETELVAEIKEWISKNITEEMLASFKEEYRNENDPETAELLYLNRLDGFVDMVLTAFPAVHASLAEQLIEDICTTYME